MSKFLNLTLAATLLGGAAFAEKFDLGRPATEEEVAAWDIDVRPDGLGLPEGSGSVEDGEMIFTDNCAMCHGDFGEAVGRWPVLAGGQDTLTDADPVKTIGSYWPYLSTVFDYVNRAMPFGHSQSLSADEVYAITAYLLYLNDIVEDDFVLSKANFTEVEMPNEANFFMDDRDSVEVPAFSAEVCMTDCKQSVEITGRAAVIDVTPEDAIARTRNEIAAAKASGGAVEAVAVAAAAAPEATPEAAPAADMPDPALVADGEKVFKKCKACHQIGEGASNKTGPQLNALFGRVAGSVEGFKYSNAFQEAHDSGLAWTEETLAEFLAKPKAYISGTKMSFNGLNKEDDIAAVIAYLRAAGQ